MRLDQLNHRHLKNRNMGSDFILFWLLLVVVSALTAIGIVKLTGLSIYSMWVLVPAMIVGLGVAVAVVWRAHKSNLKRAEDARRERAEIADAERERKLDEMRARASNIPKVKK